MNPQEKFKILHRDNFTCQYCDAKTGNDNLEVDHLIPKSLGGNDHPENLTTACRKCNRGKSNQILFPQKMIIGKDSDDWSIIKRFGVWTIKVSQKEAYICGAVYYGNDIYSTNEYNFDLNRCHEMDWEDHIDRKGWKEPHRFYDFYRILEHARMITAQ